MSIISPENTVLSILYSELKRKPSGISLREFLRESNPRRSKTLLEMCEIFPGTDVDVYHGNYSDFCREYLMNWIRTTDPPLFRSAHYGRTVVMDAVISSDRDLHDLFRHAQLNGEYAPGSKIERWWVEVADLARKRAGKTDETDHHELGRKGELVVFNHEVGLCRTYSPELKPELVSFEDNFKGWDITSYRADNNGHSKIFLEVKTTTTDKEFYVSWREARRAKVLGSSWYLVVVSIPRLQVLYFPSSCLLRILPFPDNDGVSWSECKVQMHLLPEDSSCYRYQISKTF